LKSRGIYNKIRIIMQRERKGRVMLRIAVVEDQPEVRQELCDFINRYAAESDRSFEVRAFEDGAQLVSGYKPEYSIIFLDIEMPGLDGMATAGRIREVDSEVVLVFITNMAQYAIRGYEYDALDYVLKPVNYRQFAVKLERAIRRIPQRQSEQIAVPVSGGGVHYINTDDIYYLETRDRMLYYHTADGVFAVRASLQSAEKLLAPYHFARCNQCYLVNLRYVRSAEDDFVQVKDAKLEISRRQRAAFLAAVAAYIGGTL